MKKVLNLGLSLLFLASSVQAKNAFDGPYAGVGVALGIGHNDVSQSTRRKSDGMKFSESSANLSPLGVLGGIHLGWNRAISNKYVVGLEIWGDASSLDEKVKETNGAVVDMQSKTQMDWSIGAALKGGVIMGDGLAYLSLGWVGSEWKTITSVTGFKVLAGTTIQNVNNKKFLIGFRPAAGYT